MARSTQIPDRRITWPSRNAPASSAVFVQNTVLIAAPLETVWALLIDCARWPSWYKHCSDVSLLQSGPRLGPDSKFRFKTLGFYFEPWVETFDPPHMLVWLAKGPLGSSGAHAWFIEQTPEGCRVITEEAQRGLLPALLAPRTRRMLLTAHGEWLRALKALAEAK
jgi:uncharacterized protein YndB with AHSA1/START domain